MNDLASLTRQPRPLKVPGLDETYQVHPLTIADLGGLQAWIDGHFPDPFAVIAAAIERGHYTVPQQQYLMKLAHDAAMQPAHPLGTPEADRLMQSMDGVKELLKISIRKGNPEFSDEQAQTLYMHMGLSDLQAVFAATEVELVLGDPKDAPKTSNATGSKTSRRRRKKG